MAVTTINPGFLTQRTPLDLDVRQFNPAISTDSSLQEETEAQGHLRQAESRLEALPDSPLRNAALSQVRTLLGARTVSTEALALAMAAVSRAETANGQATGVAQAEMSDAVSSARIAAEVSQLRRYSVFRDLNQELYGTVRNIMPDVDPTTAADVTLMAQRNPGFRRDLSVASLAPANSNTGRQYRSMRSQFRAGFDALLEDENISWPERQRMRNMREVLIHYPPEALEPALAAIQRYQTNPTPENRTAVLDIFDDAYAAGTIRVRTVIDRTIGSETFQHGQSLDTIAGSIQRVYGVDIRNLDEEGVNVVISEDTHHRALLGLGEAARARNMTVSQFMLAARNPEFLNSLLPEEQGHVRMLQLHESVKAQLDIEHLSRALSNGRNQLFATLMDDIQNNRGFDEIMARLPNYIQRNEEMRNRLQVVLGDPNNQEMRRQFLEAVGRGDARAASDIVSQAYMQQAETNGTQIDLAYERLSADAQRELAEEQQIKDQYYQGNSARDQRSDQQMLSQLTSSGVTIEVAQQQVLTAKEARAQERAQQRTLGEEGLNASAPDVDRNHLSLLEDRIRDSIHTITPQQLAQRFGALLGQYNVGRLDNVTYHEIENALVAAGLDAPQEVTGSRSTRFNADQLEEALRRANFVASSTAVSAGQNVTVAPSDVQAQTGTPIDLSQVPNAAVRS